LTWFISTDCAKHRNGSTHARSGNCLISALATWKPSWFGTAYGFTATWQFWHLDY
jgi:hypothetical protein